MSTTITVQLDTLQAGRIRDIDQDQLAAIFVVYVDNHPMGAIAGRLSDKMHSGDALSFGDFPPNNAQHWSLSVPLDESNPAAQLGFLVLVHNVRGIDPDIVQHYLARGAFALSTIAADVLLPENMPLLSAAASSSGLIAEALGDEIIEKLFKAPQGCAGPVFAYHTPGQPMVDLLRRAETTDNLIARIETGDIWRLTEGPVPSEPLGLPERIERTLLPHEISYFLSFSLIVDSSHQHDLQNQVRLRGLVPADDATLDNWIGKRCNRPAGDQLPSIFCTILPSETQADALAICIEEFLEGTNEVIFSKNYDGVLPASGKLILYGSDILGHRRVGRLMPQQRPYIAPEQATQAISPATMDTTLGDLRQVVLSEHGIALEHAPPPAPQGLEWPAGTPPTSIHTQPRGGLSAAHLIEVADCIILDDAKATLALYVERQGNNILGHAVRYMRPTDLLWTRVDSMLFVNDLSH